MGKTQGFTSVPLCSLFSPLLLPSQGEGKRWQPDKARVASGSRWSVFQQRGGSEQ